MIMTIIKGNVMMKGPVLDLCIKTVNLEATNPKLSRAKGM